MYKEGKKGSFNYVTRGEKVNSQGDGQIMIKTGML